MKDSKESIIGMDAESNFYVWVEGLETAAEQKSKLKREVETIGDILRPLVSISTLKKMAFCQKFIDRLHK